MNNLQIESLMRRHAATRRIFVGVYAADTLPPRPRKIRPCAYIVNTDPQKLPGTHWICCYFPKAGFEAEYFDSYGQPPVESIRFFLESQSGSFKSSSIKLQNFFSTVCAQYCIYFVMQRIADKSFASIVSGLERLSASVSDKYVNAFVEVSFGQNLPVYDTAFLLRQFATPFLQRDMANETVP